MLSDGSDLTARVSEDHPGALLRCLHARVVEMETKLDRANSQLDALHRLLRKANIPGGKNDRADN